LPRSVSFGRGQEGKGQKLSFGIDGDEFLRWNHFAEAVLRDGRQTQQDYVVRLELSEAVIDERRTPHKHLANVVLLRNILRRECCCWELEDGEICDCFVEIAGELCGEEGLVRSRDARPLCFEFWR
jgi:hypothetical protein